MSRTHRPATDRDVHEATRAFKQQQAEDQRRQERVEARRTRLDAIRAARVSGRWAR